MYQRILTSTRCENEGGHIRPQPRQLTPSQPVFTFKILLCLTPDDFTRKCGKLGGEEGKSGDQHLDFRRSVPTKAI